MISRQRVGLTAAGRRRVYFDAIAHVFVDVHVMDALLLNSITRLTTETPANEPAGIARRQPAGGAEGH